MGRKYTKGVAFIRGHHQEVEPYLDIVSSTLRSSLNGLSELLTPPEGALLEFLLVVYGMVL